MEKHWPQCGFHQRLAKELVEGNAFFRVLLVLHIHKGSVMRSGAGKEVGICRSYSVLALDVRDCRNSLFNSRVFSYSVKSSRFDAIAMLLALVSTAVF